MKGKSFLLVLIFFFSIHHSFGQGDTRIAYYDAIYLKKILAANNGQIILNDDIKKVLKYYFQTDQDAAIKQAIQKNSFLASTLNISDAQGIENFLSSAPHSNFLGKIAGLDVTNIANGIADLMIERAKEELTVAFFERFKKFAKDNEEFEILFPKTTENLSNLLAYTYPQMLPALRTGFLDDLSKITYNLDDILALPRYQVLLKNFPEARIAVKSIRLIHELETGASNAADIIKEFSSFSEWTENANSSTLKNTGALLSVARLFSESIRNDTSVSHNNNIWISATDLKQIFYDKTLFQLYMGLIYQKAKTDSISFYNNDSQKRFSDILDTLNKNNDLFVFQNKLREFFDLTAKVNSSYKDLKSKIDSGKDPSNDDYFNYINTSIDVIDYSFSLLKIADVNIPKVNNYLSLARKSNNLYKDIYTKEYTQAVSDGLDILKEVHDKVSNDAIDFTGKKDALGKLLGFLEKVKPYALFMANMVEAKSAADVKAALANVILPVGSSSIKKNSSGNISVQTYLGAYWGSSKSSGGSAWSDRFGVIAPIGLSWTPGFLSWQKYGSLSLFGALFDLGAIVDYKLKRDSTINSNGTTTSVVNKDYTIKLGQLFSPGAYIVYGAGANLPLALGFGGQYGPGLSKIDAGNNAVVTNPSWRWNIFLAVDLPFFTLKNKTKNN